MFQNSPNPCNPTTVLSYQLPAINKATLRIYYVLGRKVAALVNEEQSTGWKEAEWNAMDVSSGIYFYKLQALQKDGRQTATTLSSGLASNFVDIKKLMFLK